MNAVIVPCLNEEKGIRKVLENLLPTSADIIVVVANGCSDNSVELIKSINSSKIKILIYNEALGLDVPRAIGAKFCYDLGASSFLFVDGDMTGNLTSNFDQLIDAINRKNLDLALTNCYPGKNTATSPLANNVLDFRCRLNKELGFFHKLGVATPSHGPHALSRHFLRQVDFLSLAKPPLLLSLAKAKGLNVGIGTIIAHHLLESTERTNHHNHQIADTIIGDCIEALCSYKGKDPSRSYKNKFYHGYNPYRRLDILKSYLTAKK